MLVLFHIQQGMLWLKALRTIREGENQRQSLWSLKPSTRQPNLHRALPEIDKLNSLFLDIGEQYAQEKKRSMSCNMWPQR